MGKGKGRRLLALVAALVVVAMLAAGCGGGKAKGGGDGASGETVVKIGLGAPLTAGDVALGQGMKRGALLAIKQANESQRAKDLKIRFEGVDGDDQSDPKTGTAVAETFASTNGLVGVMGHLNSSVSEPASKVYFENDIVQVSPASTNPKLTENGRTNFFRVCTVDSVQGPAAADFAYNDLGFKSVFVVDDSTTYGEGLADEFEKKFVANGGKSVKREKTTDKTTDFAAVVTNIKSQNPDLVYYGGTYKTGAYLSKQLSDAGVKAPVMGGDGLYTPEWVNLAGQSQAEGDYCTSVGYPTDTLPKGQEFQAAYKAEYPNENIEAYDAYAYDATNVIIEAVLNAAEEVGAGRSLARTARRRSSPPSPRPTSKA